MLPAGSGKNIRGAESFFRNCHFPLTENYLKMRAIDSNAMQRIYLVMKIPGREVQLATKFKRSVDAICLASSMRCMLTCNISTVNLKKDSNPNF